MNAFKANDDGNTNDDRNLHRKLHDSAGYNDSEEATAKTIADIRQSKFYDHNILIYPDLDTFRKIYSKSAKQALNSNEIVLLITTYDSFATVIDSLTQSGISVNNETKEGNLIILDSVKAYQIDTYGAMKFAKSLVNRITKDGKAGIFNISDLGSFFVAERIPIMLEYENSLPKKMDFLFKAICAYHKDDFATLSEQQQEKIFSSHNHVIVHNKVRDR